MFWSAATVVPLAERLARVAVDVVCGPLVGGALLGQLVAARLGVAFVHAERTTTGDGLHAADYRVPLASDTGLPITSLAEWPNLLHESASCSLSAAGEPLETPD